MSRRWLPDRGWTGAWELPRLLCRPVTDAERGGLVALSMAGMGPARMAKTLHDAEAIDDVVRHRDAKHRLRELERMGMRAIVPSDDEYPDDLGEIDAAPTILYVRGTRLDALQPMVGIVGARACTRGAARFARRLGETFAHRGFTVVSGLARGIDGAAHRGALESGKTVAVLGTGLDICYPPEHRELADAIVTQGALVSEFPPRTGPRAWHFPSRNRIISGLSCAVIVVEAGVGSGALITAGFALDHGRHVFACTTGPENPAGAGVRELLLDGAHLVVDADQAVDDLVGMLDEQLGPLPRAIRTRDALEPPEHLRPVYDAIVDDLGAEEIARLCGRPSAEVASALAELELDGFVVCEQMRWRRAGG